MARGSQLHLITDRKQTPGDLAPAVAAALRGGIDVVQVREKTAPAEMVFAMVRSLLPLARAAGARLLVNDRVDVALVAGADGVHLPARGLRPDAVRSLIAGGLIGVSVHDVADARRAVAAGADYVTFGHVFPTASHLGQPPRGLQSLRAVVAAVDAPVLAIGGITATNAAEVLATGCAGIAVISAILKADDPERAARILRAAIDASSAVPRVPFPQREQVFSQTGGSR